METKQEQRLHARNLYFGTNMSQQEIADQCSINRKTLYLWMNEGGWRHAKYAAAHAPALLLDQYYEQLGRLNQHIASRENPWPTKDEATTIRKITMSINLFKESTGIKQTMNIFHDFIKYLQVNENKWEMAKEFMLPIDRFVKKTMEDKKWFGYNFNAISNEEQHFEREYAEWLKTQPLASGEEQQSQPDPNLPAERHGSESPIPNSNKEKDVILSPSKDELKQSAAKPRPLTYEEVKQKVEAIDSRKKSAAQPLSNSNPPAGMQEPKKEIEPTPDPNSKQQIPNLPADRHGSQTPIPHPRLPRYLNTNDIQKMMETPQPGQQPNNFNPKRY